MFNRFTRRILGTTPMQAAIDRVTTDLGIEPENRVPDRAAFHLPYCGRSYVVILELLDNKAGLVVFTNAKFPPRRIPNGIQEFLEDRNQELTKSHWKIHHGSSSSWLLVMATCDMGAMNGATFMAGAAALMEEAAAMDATLRRLGLA